MIKKVIDKVVKNYYHMLGSKKLLSEIVGIERNAYEFYEFDKRYSNDSDHKLLIFSILWVFLSSAGVVLGINDKHYIILGIIWGLY